MALSGVRSSCETLARNSDAAELPAQVRHQEGHVQDVDLLRQDVILEAVMEHHDRVEGDGATDENRHGQLSAKAAIIAPTGSPAGKVTVMLLTRSLHRRAMANP